MCVSPCVQAITFMTFDLGIRPHLNQVHKSVTDSRSQDGKVFFPAMDARWVMYNILNLQRGTKLAYNMYTSLSVVQVVCAKVVNVTSSGAFLVIFIHSFTNQPRSCFSH